MFEIGKFDWFFHVLTRDAAGGKESYSADIFLKKFLNICSTVNMSDLE